MDTTPATSAAFGEAMLKLLKPDREIRLWVLKEEGRVVIAVTEPRVVRPIGDAGTVICTGPTPVDAALNALDHDQ